MRMKGRGGRRGFTLPELVMAMSIAVLAVALATPRMDAVLTRIRVRNAANRVAADIAYARQLAARTGHRTRVRLLPSGDCPGPRGWTAGHRYLVLGRTAADSVAVTGNLRLGGGRVCLASNQSDAVHFGSHGVLAGFNNRTLVISEGRMVDSLIISAVGRVRRRY